MGQIIDKNWDIGIEKFKRMPEKLRFYYLSRIGEEGIKKLVKKYPESIEYMPNMYKKLVLSGFKKEKNIEKKLNSESPKETIPKKFSELSNEEKEKFLLNKKEFPDEISDSEIWEFCNITRNKEVFKICIESLSLFFVKKIINDPNANRNDILKLTMYPDNFLTSDILKREDIDSGILYQMIKNFEDIEIYPLREMIINHEKMDEEALYKLCECENNQILSQILLSNKVSDRIIKKLQSSKDVEIKTMALVIDKETNQDFINQVIDKEFKKAIKVNDDFPTQNKNHKTILLTDILMAALKNPKLSSEALEKYRYCVKNIVINNVIKHPNISNEMLEFYKENGVEEVQQAAIEKIEERNCVDFSEY